MLRKKAIKTWRKCFFSHPFSGVGEKFAKCDDVLHAMLIFCSFPVTLIYKSKLKKCCPLMALQLPKEQS